MSSSTGRRAVVVGCGNMGFALLSGWLRCGLEPACVLVVEPAEGLRQRAASLGVRVAADASALPEDTDFVILAVKPQVLPDILPDYRPLAGKATFISIAAGVTLATLEQGLGSSAAIVRAMPNTPAAIGKGSTVIHPNARVTPAAQAAAEMLLAAGGAVHAVGSEALIDAATAVSGSGPAYLFHVMECLGEAGRSLGLPAGLALSLAKETVFGAGALAMSADEEPAGLRRQVTSPNGTTAAALAVLMRDGALEKLMGEAVHAAFHRSIELSGASPKEG